MGVYAALAAHDVRSALLLAVNHSGDSDSTGAIARSLLGAVHGVEALPGDLLGDVELRGLIVTLADDLVDVQSCDEESMSDRRQLRPYNLPRFTQFNASSAGARR